MSSRPLGRRAGWLVAAAILIAGGSVGLDSRPAPTGAPVDPVAVVDAATDGGIQSKPAGSAVGAGAASALAADLVGWPTAAIVTNVPPALARIAAVKAPKAPPKAPPPWWSRFVGTNHVWMPTLGVNRRVYSFPCSRGASPDNLVYRWGCAGRNNVYLLGHAYGVFRALHDAYANGKLRVGMPVIYADSRGHVQLYRVVTWRVVHPANATWAMASQRVPSMTLQTCIGPSGSLRLNVRLVAANS